MVDRCLPLRVPKPDTEFRCHEHRLALFHRAQDHLGYWRSYWSEPKRAALIRKAEAGDLGELEGLLIKYVPRHLPVLEAGCGPGHVVAALARRGYRATGIDYEPEVVRFAQATVPRLDVREGNVLALDFRAGTIGCYLSLGVVEHFVEGPHAALIQARRVLHPQGVALISVPYLNPMRRNLLLNLADSGVEDSGLSFHQYYFSIEDFARALRRAGLKVVDLFPYAVEAFLAREHPLFSGFWTSPLCREFMRRRLRRHCAAAPMWWRMRYAHMALFVCKPV